MDPDLPLPSVEREDGVGLLKNTLSNKRHTHESRLSLNSAAATPLPPSSPLKSPRKTPRPEKHTALTQQRHVSPSYSSSRPDSSPGQSTSPTLSSKRSFPSLNGRTPSTSSTSPFRRTSSNLNPSSPFAKMTSSTLNGTSEASHPTPASVATEYFSRELRQQDTDPDTSTIVLAHDSCYGHRYSRPKTSKASLSTIVERPERIHATILGISTAYVRLGERHATGRFGPHPKRDTASYSPPPFKFRKTSRILPLNHPATTHVHGAKWMEELQIMCDCAEAKLALNGKELVRPIGYGKDESGNLLPKLHEGDLYLCAESLHALQACLGGVCDAVDAVFASSVTRRAFVCIRPPGHHCSSSFPSGFCWLNNVHVGLTYAAMSHGLTHAAIIDFDLHHGDGSQSITWDHNRRAQTLPKNAAPYKRTPIGYFSIHDINSYPCEWGDEEKVRNASVCIENAHGQSIWNVHLEPWKDLDDFMRLYKERYLTLLEKARNFLRLHTQRLSRTNGEAQPKAAIFLSAGFDASEWEGEGMQRHKVNVPTDFYARFTADVVKMSYEEDLGVDGRVISVLEGGYSDRALTSGALSHLCGLAGVSEVIKGSSPVTAGQSKDSELRYDPAWWQRDQLECLEARVHANAPIAAIKKQEKGPSNYTSPTQASDAKMTDVARERRSLSAQFESRMSLENVIEPTPEVDWATAAYEFSRLIIPSDRQTLSCRHDELNAEATRARKERQSAIGVADFTLEPMQLRDRKVRPHEADNVLQRPPSRGDRRRTTIAAAADLPDPGFGLADSELTAASSRPRRRSSGASSIVSALQGMKLHEGISSSSREQSEAPTRQGSMAPSRPTKPVVAKKPAANMKVTAKPRSSPRKADGSAPPVPRISSAYTKPPKVQQAVEEITTDQKSSSQTRSGSTTPVVRTDDLADLSTNMKKMSIKLKVKTPDKMGTKPLNGEEKIKKPKAPRKPTVPRQPKTFKAGVDTAGPGAGSTPPETLTRSDEKTTVPAKTTGYIPMNKVNIAASTVSNSIDTIITNPVPPRDASALGVEAQTSSVLSSLKLGENDPSGCITEDLNALQPHSDAMLQDVFPGNPVSRSTVVHESAEVPETPANRPLPLFPNNSITPPIYSTTPQPPARPENISTSSASAPATTFATKKTRVDLPVFTSTSPIPFARANVNISNALNDQLALDEDVLPARDVVANKEVNGHGFAVKNGENNNDQPQGSDRSIWDLPETPMK